jgi:dipeptidyl aminopeptidase/acylaminoacyl peptidase
VAGKMRALASDSFEAEVALRKMGKFVELIMYDDDGHAFLMLENVLDSELHCMTFLAKYLESGIS